MTGLLTQNGQDLNDGAPPAQVTPTNERPPAPTVGPKPRLVDKLEDPGATEISIETWNLLEEGKTDNDSGEE